MLSIYSLMDLWLNILCFLYYYILIFLHFLSLFLFYSFKVVFLNLKNIPFKLSLWCTMMKPGKESSCILTSVACSSSNTKQLCVLS